MKIKILAVIAAVISLLSLAGCNLADKLAQPKETATARPTVRVTVPEGFTVYQTAQLLEENGVCPSSDFIGAVNAPPADNTFAAAITNKAERPFLLEGYVFPDTYDFYVGESAERALGRFLSNMKTKLTDADYARAAELGLTMDRILTVASLVQEESGFAAQDAKVASVIYNRLNSKNFARLQLNVTFEYLDKSVEPVITGARGKYGALYNTYDRKGLPAGPISNPGRSAIEAALYPADTDYFYFVTDKDMNYYYARTYAEHLANCKKAGVSPG